MAGSIRHSSEGDAQMKKLLLIALLLPTVAFGATIGDSTPGSWPYGGPDYRSLDGNARGRTVTMPSGTFSAGVTITGYITDSGTGDDFTAAIVSDSDDMTVLAESAVRTDISTAGSYTFSGGTLATFTPAASTTYHIVIGSTSASGAQINFGPETDVGAAGSGGISGVNPMVFPFVIGADASRGYSIYMTYSEAGGSAVPIIMQHQ